MKYGYTFTRNGWTNPVAIGPESSVELNWTAQAEPVVRIEAVDAIAAESGTNTARFLISRTGLTNSALAVRFNRSVKVSENPRVVESWDCHSH